MDAKTKCQRIILEAFYKVCELVLDSRGFEKSLKKRRSRSKNKPHPSFNLVIEKKSDVRYVVPSSFFSRHDTKLNKVHNTHLEMH